MRWGAALAARLQFATSVGAPLQMRHARPLRGRWIRCAAAPPKRKTNTEGAVSMTTTLWPLIASAVIAGASLSGCGKQSPDALIASAKQYLSQGDQKAASIQLKNALQTNPDLPEARFLLGKALLEAEDPVS